MTTPTKTLSGGAKNYLDDLLLLNGKVTAEMVRGIGTGYLDANGAVALATKLGVEPPRVKRDFTLFFTVTEVHSFKVSAYDEEQARAEGDRLMEHNVAYGSIQYGARSRFNRRDSVIRRRFSKILWDRPQAGDQPEMHPWEVRRIEADAEGRDISTTLTRELRSSSVIPRT